MFKIFLAGVFLAFVSVSFAQGPLPQIVNLPASVPSYVKNPETLARMAIVELLEEENESHFGLIHTNGPAVNTLSTFDADTVSISLTDCAHVRRIRRNGRSRFYIFLRKRFPGFVTIRLGNTLYDIPEDESFRGEITVNRPLPPPIPWENFYAAQQVHFSEQTIRRIMQASVRAGVVDSLAAGTVVQPPLVIEQKLRKGEMAVLCSGHQVSDIERHKEIVVDVSKLSGLKVVGFERCQARLIATSEGIPLGFELDEDCGWLAFTPRSTVPEPVEIADANRWLRNDQKLVQVGCPGGVMPRWRYNRAVSAEKQQRGGRVFLGEPSVGGDSGGGIFDADGVLVLTLVDTSGSSSYEKGRDLLGSRSEIPRSVVGERSGAWHPQTAIVVAEKYFERAPEQRVKELKLVAEEIIGSLPESRQLQARKKLIELQEAFQ